MLLLKGCDVYVAMAYAKLGLIDGRKEAQKQKVKIHILGAG